MWPTRRTNYKTAAAAAAEPDDDADISTHQLLRYVTFNTVGASFALGVFTSRAAEDQNVFCWTRM